MKILISSLSLSFLALTLVASTETISNGNSLQRSDCQLKPLPASARLAWHGGPRLVYDDSLREQGLVGSYNWSGYAATNALVSGTGGVSYVAGTWIVNAVTGNSGQYAAVWVGIDGFDSSTVEQLGTLAYITATGFGRNAKTEAQYYAWVEMYPAGMYQIPLAVNPGDSITASVTWKPGTTSYEVYMKDNTTGLSYGPTPWTGSSSAKQNSAEWIVEAPSSNFGILPLADFGTELFSSCTATIADQNDGANAGIDSFATLEDIIMVSERGNQAMAATVVGSLYTTGFSDKWDSSGP
jgi:hypothetical protein